MTADVYTEGSRQAKVKKVKNLDAFAVSVCKGLSLEKSELKKALYAGLWFGFFQALMPVIGYFTGDKLSEYVAAFDHWVVFFLLSAIGVNMIKESFDKNSAINGSFKMTGCSIKRPTNAGPFIAAIVD